MEKTTHNTETAIDRNLLLSADVIQSKKNEILWSIYKQSELPTWNETTQLLNELIELSQKGAWFEVSKKQPPFEAEILFQTKAGNVYAGIRFMPTEKSLPVYQDFKKLKIRRNIVKWRYICP